MKIRKVTTRVIDEEQGGVRLAGGVNAVVSGTIGEEEGSSSRVSARQRVRVVQRRTRRATGEEARPGGEAV